MTSYEEFEIRFVGAGSQIRLIARTPEGEATADLVVPAEEESSMTTPALTGATVERQPGREVGVGIAPLAGDLQQRGESLFAALFPPPLLQLLDACSGGSTDGADRRVRIRLRFDLGDPVAAAASRLPWELVYRNRGFLALDPRYAIVRAVDAPRPVSPPRFDSPLRVLLASAAPRGTSALKLHQEIEEVRNAWRGPQVAVTTVRDVTRRSLQQALDGSTAHVLHFMGHGRMDDASMRGSLVFDTGTGGVDEVYGDTVATLLRSPHLRLVVLNACDTARGATAGAAAFAHVAGAMSWAGVPAVVAMQKPILDASAIDFGSVLHHRLAAGDPLEAAVQQARVALQVKPAGNLDWFTPAVFLRAPDGHLFQPPVAPVESSPTSRSTMKIGGNLDVDLVEVTAEKGTPHGTSTGGASVAELDVEGDANAKTLIITGREFTRRSP